MNINTDLLPSGPYQHVVVLIDVLRTCTVAPLLFDKGVASLTLTPSLKSARSAAAKSGALLVGERQGVPPEGFNHGNSPVQLANADVAGRPVVMVSENAPRRLAQLATGQALLLGSLYNAAAVADAVVALAPERVDLVGSGFAGEPDLDDAVAAALIAELIKQRTSNVTFSGATRFATTLARALPDPLDALWRSLAGQYLRSIDLEQDVAFAARVSASSAVPLLTRVEEAEPEPLFHFAVRAAG
ncbi:MAG: 2-phosphosulfolactate phosphatase [Trueperaceae bacterium]